MHGETDHVAWSDLLQRSRVNHMQPLNLGCQMNMRPSMLFLLDITELMFAFSICVEPAIFPFPQTEEPSCIPLQLRLEEKQIHFVKSWLLLDYDPSLTWLCLVDFQLHP